jgi:threonine/homoserine/homoserine lactone efflux protein
VLVSLPGPAVIYVVMQSLDQGRQAGMVSVLGIGTSTFGYTVVAAAAVLAGPTAASDTTCRHLSAAYLIYLGVRKLLERQKREVTVSSTRSRHYLGGLIIQARNPKIAIFFLALLPRFVRPSAGPLVAQILIFGTLCGDDFGRLGGSISSSRTSSRFRRAHSCGGQS